MSNEQQGEQLLPCPWCGTEAAICYDGNNGFALRCMNDMTCVVSPEVQGDVGNERWAINTWNTRSRAAAAAPADETMNEEDSPSRKAANKILRWLHKTGYLDTQWIMTSAKRRDPAGDRKHGNDFLQASLTEARKEILNYISAVFERYASLTATTSSPAAQSDATLNHLRALLARYTQPCPDDCEHAHCPLLRELYAIVISGTLERAQLKVKPIVDRERAGESVGDLMNMRLRTSSGNNSTWDRAIEIVTAMRNSSLWNANGYDGALSNTLEKLRSAATPRASEGDQNDSQ